MVKKIKVVEMQTAIAQAEEQEQEMQQALPPSSRGVGTDPSLKGAQEAIAQAEEVEQPQPALQEQNSEIREPKQKKPKQPRKPKAPIKTTEPTEQAIEDKPKEEDSDSIDTDEMIEVIKSHRQSKKGGKRLLPPPPQATAPPPPQATAPQAIPQAQEKQEEKTRCPDCNKLLTTKSLKYAHAKNCRAKAPAKEEQPRADFMLKAIDADKNKQIAEAVQHPISVLLAAERAMRMGQRRERIESLLTNAF